MSILHVHCSPLILARSFLTALRNGFMSHPSFLIEQVLFCPDGYDKPKLFFVCRSSPSPGTPSLTSANVTLYEWYEHEIS